MKLALTRENVAWAAGLFEGEGSIVAKNDHGSVLQLAMTDEDVIRRFAQIMSVGNVRGPYRLEKPEWKPIWLWSTGKSEHVQYVLAVLWPWLGERRKTKATDELSKLTFLGVGGSGSGRCRRGHFLYGNNVYIRPDGYKECKPCAALRTRERRARACA